MKIRCFCGGDGFGFLFLFFSQCFFTQNRISLSLSLSGTDPFGNHCSQSIC